MEAISKYPMREARFYAPCDDGSKAVQCCLCHHRCRIAPGCRGVCAARENRDGVLYSLVYGRCVAMNADPVEKKPLFHFLSGSRTMSIATPGCNFRCPFCQNSEISQFLKDHPERFPAGVLTYPDVIVEEALDKACASIAFTYTEPTIFFEYAEDTGKLALAKGLPSCFVSNGFMTPEAVEAMVPWVRAINVDLKCFNPETYRNVLGGRLEGVLETLARLHESGIWIEITTLLVPGMNDSPEEIEAIADFIANLDPKIPWHLSRYYPHYKMLDREPTPLKTIEAATRIGKEAGLHFIYTGNTTTGAQESTHCMKCGELLIRRSGFMVVDMPMSPGGACPSCGTVCPGVWMPA